MLFISVGGSSNARRVQLVLISSHLRKIEGIACYALYKSVVMIMPCNADDICLFIELPDEI